jgi:hypothetical protein
MSLFGRGLKRLVCGLVALACVAITPVADQPVAANTDQMGEWNSFNPQFIHIQVASLSRVDFVGETGVTMRHFGSSTYLPDATLTLGIVETGNFGNRFEGTRDADGVIKFAFTGTSQDLVLSFSGYDIDRSNEVEVLVNGVSLGFLEIGEKNGLAEYSFNIGAAQQIDGQEQEISFVQAKNARSTWGVTDILLDPSGGTSGTTDNDSTASTNDTTTTDVTPVNVAPVAVDDSATTNVGVAVVLSVLDNDSDPDGDPLTITDIGDPANGSAVVNGDGTITYTPDANFTGTDTFTYTIADGVGGTSTAAATVVVDAVCGLPVFGDRSCTTDEDTGIVLSVSGNNGETATILSVSDPGNGSAVVNGDGTITYTPDADFNGTDTFTYTIPDGSGGTSTSTVTVLVDPVNDAPVAVDDSATTNEGTAVVLSALDNDSDVDGDALTITGVSDPANGQAVVNDNGTITYTPGAGFSGTDSFTYTVSDGAGGTETGTVNLTVQPADGSVIDVSDAAGLMAALENAEGGETIRLAPGDYGALTLNAQYGESWAKYETPVTITSADLTDIATLTGLKLVGVTGLVFDDLLFDYTSANGAAVWTSPFAVSESSDITIRNSILDGDLAHGLNAVEDGYGTGNGLNFFKCDHVTIEGNEFFNWHRAATFGEMTGLEIVGNDVHAIRSDGFDFSAVQGVLIENNHLHDFVTAPNSGDHADMIQFWTYGTTAPSTDITIRGNWLMSGEGAYTQSIFMGNEEVYNGRAGSEMFYQNIAIEDNLIWNAQYHGISVGETTGLRISHNTVLHNAASGDEGSVSVPQIDVSAVSQDVTVTHNISSAIPEAQADWTVADNLLVQRDSPGLPNYYADLFVNALNDGLAGIEDLQALPGGVVETGGYGAAVTRYDATPDALTAVMHDERAAGDLSLFDFDAGFTAGPDGLVDASEAEFHWDFGDGTNADGITASHDFTAPGSYVVTLEVVAADGSRDVTESRVNVADPLFVDIDVANGTLADMSTYGASVDSSGVVFTQGRNGGEAVYLDTDSGFALNRGEIGQIYDLDEFTYTFGFRADASGEIMRIHTAFEVSLNTTGQISTTLTNADEQTFTLHSQPGLLDGSWHDVAITFDGTGGTLALYVDGVYSGGTAASGHTQPEEWWGLTVGGEWGNGFTGELDRLQVYGEVLDPAVILQEHEAGYL